MSNQNSGPVIGTALNSDGGPKIESGKGALVNVASKEEVTLDKQFATDHLLQNLKGRTVSSGFVTGVAQAAQFGLNFLSVVVLARLLAPQDHGLIAMVGAIMGFLRIFSEAGLSTATVQRDEITQSQVSNLFWTNVGLGGLVSLVLIVSSPAIAWFYREPRLVSVTMFLAITFLLSSSAVQHLALLKRQMQFTKIALIQVGSAAAGVLMGISMAWRHYGYWSLVGMQLTTQLVALLLTWFSSKWRPQWISRGSGMRSMLSFGANLTASNLVWSLARGTDAILIGKYYDASSLGLYSRAGSLLARPIDQFMAPIEAVLMPTFCRLISQPDRYRRVALQVFEVVALTSFLFTGLLFGLAQPLILVVLGPQWSEAVPMFAGFTLVALYIPIGSIASWLVTTQGRGQEVLGGGLIGSFLTVVAFTIGLSFGPVGVAYSYSIYCCFVALPITFYISGRKGPVSSKDLWIGFLKHLPVWGVVCGTTFLARTFCADTSPVIQLLVCVPVGIAAGVTFIAISRPSRRVALDALTTLRELKAHRNPLS